MFQGGGGGIHFSPQQSNFSVVVFIITITIVIAVIIIAVIIIDVIIIKSAYWHGDIQNLNQHHKVILCIDVNPAECTVVQNKRPT